ncbi:unnamed protein product [Prunus brigantina]
MACRSMSVPAATFLLPIIPFRWPIESYLRRMGDFGLCTPRRRSSSFAWTGSGDGCRSLRRLLSLSRQSE